MGLPPPQKRSSQASAEVRLPPILSRLEKVTPSYGSLHGRGYHDLVTQQEDAAKRKHRPDFFLAQHLQEHPCPKRGNARQRSEPSMQIQDVIFGPSERPGRGSRARVAKSASLPQLPALADPFDHAFSAAKRAVARKKMEKRWTHEAVCDRVEATRRELMRPIDRIDYVLLRAKHDVVVEKPARPVVLPPLAVQRKLTEDSIADGTVSASSGSASSKAALAPDVRKGSLCSDVRVLSEEAPQAASAPRSPKEAGAAQSERSAEVAKGDPGKSPLEMKFERAWKDVLDPSGYTKDAAWPMFNMYSRLVYEGDTEVDKQDLPLVCNCLGYSELEKSALARIADEITPFGTVTFEEFLRFLHRCVELEQAFWQVTFSKYDLDNSGSISIDELREVLHDLGYTPMRSMLQEALASVDEDGSGQIELEEFKILMKNWRAMEGLTKEEFAEIEDLFTRFDSNSDGELSVAEQTRLKKYLGLKGDTAEGSEIYQVQRLPIVWKGFLAEVRRCREHEIKSFRELFDKQDADASGELDVSELCSLMRSVGVEPMTDRLKECISSVDADDNGCLSFEEFVHIMWLYRRTEGFSADELAEFQVLFKKYDRDDSGEIESLELGDLLRQRGYNQSLEELQRLCEEFDVDGTGDIGMREFLKLMRRLREDDIRRFRQIFESNANKETQTMATQHIAGVLEELGHEVSMESCTEALRTADADGSGELDWDEFVQLMDRYRLLEVRASLRNCGFDDARLDTFRQAFHSYDVNRNGTIDNSELLHLLKDLNLAPRSELERVQLLSKLQRCREQAEEFGGHNTFWVFLQLMRDMEADQDRGSLAVERRAIENAGFARQEVSEFREVFDHWHARLSELGPGCGAAAEGKAFTAEGISRILRSLGVSLPKMSDCDVLEGICRECDFDKSGSVDFPDFLMVMSKLLEINFRGLNELIARE